MKCYSSIETVQQGPRIDGDDRVLPRRAAAIILLYGLALLSLGLPGTRVLSYHEARYALGAKEMVASGRWLVPTVLDEPRVRKPPFTYWVIALSLRVFGRDGEWVVRLPSTLAALFVALTLARLTTRWLGARIGLVTGLAQLSSVYVIVQSGLADPDMLLCAAVTVALAAFARASLAPPAGARGGARLSALVFHTSLGIAFLIKGPIGPLFVVLPIVVLAFRVGPTRALRPFLDPLGLGVLVLLVTVWPLAVYRAYPFALDQWASENLGRFQGELGREPVYFYLSAVLWLTLPWTPIAGYGLWRRLNAEGARPALVDLLVAWSAVGLLMLSLSAGKHDRYAAPALPPLAVFAAIGICDLAPRLPKRSMASILAAVWVVTAIAELAVVPRIPNRYRDQADCARRLDRRLSPSDRVFLVEIPNNRRTQIAYYLSMRVERADAIEQLPSGDRDLLVLLPESALSRVAIHRKVEIVERCAGQAELALARLSAVEP